MSHSRRTAIYTYDLPTSFKIFEILDQTSQMRISTICFICLIPLENFSLIWKRHHYQWRATNFDLYSALMEIEQWGFFNAPHLLWNGSTLENGNLRWPVTLLPVAEHWVRNCHYLFKRLRSVPIGDRTLIPRMRGERYTTTTPRGVNNFVYIDYPFNEF